MSDAEWQEAKRIFDEALRQKPEERARFVSEVCGEDKSLCREVESLLSSFDGAGSFLETPVWALHFKSTEFAVRRRQKHSRYPLPIVRVRE